ncbi:hypothetical protein [Rhizobium sp. BK456]|uniref:hypothetical protein n=1 Tax=Rhizobium sp. BK456 TaxID=2587007 RepID=UPI00161586F3|nr:hypothetical protein [Rhizobium sp. BK456]MBB3521104.1 hypothetical protein [Rhizobium sp. BK456]
MTTNSRAPITDDELEHWARLRADDAGHLARELITYRRGDAAYPHLKALKTIAAPRECGCSPVCQCNTEEALKIEVDYLKDLALSALAPQAGDNAEEPVAWRWESAYGGEPLIGKWNVATVKPTRFSDATAFACEPLYTHQCTSTPVVSQNAPDLEEGGDGDIIKAICKAVVLGEDENYKPVHLEPREARQAIAAYLEASWRPISEADKSVDRVYELGELRIANSEEYWVRDEDGRIYQATWADDGKRAYWWDLEGESPVDPVEFMPHPLDPSFHSEVKS